MNERLERAGAARRFHMLVTESDSYAFVCGKPDEIAELVGIARRSAITGR